jgi:hypothetical protein
VINCTFTGNSASYGGAMMNYEASPTLTNCVFSNNSANFGGAVANYYSSAVILLNCTFTANSALTAGGGIWNDTSVSTPGTVTNCIFWADSPDEINANSSTLTVTYTCLAGGWTGDRNIDADPLFRDAQNADYRLASASPCINAGDSNSVPPDYTDLDDDQDTSEPIPWDIQGPAGPGRVYGAAVDMGAYEADVLTANIVPVANAGDDQAVFATVDGTAEVSLDGSGSYDEDGNDLTYLWQWTIDDVNYTAEGVNPTISLPEGEHIIELIVNDGIDDSAPDQVVVTVTAPIQTELALYPEPIRRYSGSAGILVQVRLPDGITAQEVGGPGQLLLYPGAIAGARPPHYMYYDLGIPAEKRISAFFLKSKLIAAIPQDAVSVELKLVGRLPSGRYFYGAKTVRITP